MPDNSSKRPFRATDVLVGSVRRDASSVDKRLDEGKLPRKRVTLHLTYEQIETLSRLYFRLNQPQLPRRIEKSELGGLAIEILEKMLPEGRVFASFEELSEFLHQQVADIRAGERPKKP